VKSLAAFGAITFLFSAVAAQQSPSVTPDKLVYADFENSDAEHVTSSRGGIAQPVGWQADDSKAPTLEPVFLDPDGSFSKRMAFNYKLAAGQKYTGAALMINGLPDKDGKPQPEDLSGYKEMAFDMEAGGPRRIKVQFLSQKTNLTVVPGFEPSYVVDVKPGFETYRISMKKVDTPKDTPPNSASAKAILKQVTGIQIVTDEQGSSGHIIIDNVIFQK
jgi:hypothetical protein